MGRAFYTVGHGTRPLAAFVELMGEFAVETLADVRTIPRSRTNPQYNHDALARSLGALGIEYRHIPELGGLRGRQKDVPVAANAFWQNQSFHNYADYAMSAEFHAGLCKLLRIGRAKTCAIMCAETVWWRCHRRIISDYLIGGGESVLHILGPGHVEPAQLTEAAQPGSGGVLTYPAKL